jgi:hypothetical protein
MEKARISFVTNSHTNGEGDALAVFLAELFKGPKSNNDIATVTMDSINKLWGKQSKYNAGGLPQLVQEVLDKQYTDGEHWSFMANHIWNVLNDPAQQFIMKEDGIVMRALCIRAAAGGAAAGSDTGPERQFESSLVSILHAMMCLAAESTREPVAEPKLGRLLKDIGRLILI